MKIRHRYGAVARPQAVAVIDRFFRSVQVECLRPWMVALPLRRVRARLQRYVRWFARERVHQGLQGATPAAVWRGERPRDRLDPEEVVGLVRRDFESDATLPVYELLRAA